jgi:nitrite reductase (NADH) small subunit
MQKNWVNIGKFSDLPKQGARRVRTATGDIAVFRTVDDGLFALEDRCPHKGGPLSQGIVHGNAVACPLHNWSISLATGEAMGADNGCTPRIGIKRDGDDVFLELATTPILQVA